MSLAVGAKPGPGRADVVVLGAGLVGLSLGLALARRGVETVILDLGDAEGPFGGGTALPSGAVDAQSRPGPAPEALRDLGLLSRNLFGDWIEALEEETGLACEYDVRGGLAAALTEGEEVLLDRALDWQRARALPFEVLPAEEARAREPALSAAVRAAFSFPGDGQLAPPRLARALLLASRRAGALVTGPVPVPALHVEAGCIAGVETPQGLLRADAVVVAAGAATSRVASLPALPAKAVRTPHLLLDAAADGDRLTRFICGARVLLVPRRDGTLVVSGGADDGLAPQVSAGEAADLVLAAAALVPAAVGYPLVASWTSHASASTDGGPLLGETAVPGLFVAAGEGAGALVLVPAFALLLADLLTGRTPPLPVAPFSPARFGL
ncbi:MAG: NAD(P)/FAD-dependent oxidoreductase [Thermoanaerobaculia bacterium]